MYDGSHFQQLSVCRSWASFATTEVIPMLSIMYIEIDLFQILFAHSTYIIIYTYIYIYTRIYIYIYTDM